MEGALLAAPAAFSSSCRKANALSPSDLQQLLRALTLVRVRATAGVLLYVKIAFSFAGNASVA